MQKTCKISVSCLLNITCPSRPPGTSSSAANLAIASSAGWMSPRLVLKISATKTKVALSITSSLVCSCKYSSRGDEMASRSSWRRSSVFFLLMKETAHYCRRFALSAHQVTGNFRIYVLFETFKLLLDLNTGISAPSVSCTIKHMLGTEFKNTWSEKVFKADCLIIS